ncbi:MAG: acyl-CoA mutase large subunit family protein [Candidatus Accumulibacter sp.]|jgi:methylmalonyl-CoA mutase|nr:acyl-CoA mutase large subunit family protein [Accumulibacter sp.]
MEEQTATVDITRIDAEHGFFDEFEKPDKKRWKEEAIAALKGAPFDKVLYTKTYEGLSIEPIYCAEDVEGLPHLASKPGFPPFVRGTRPNGFIEAPWQICQEITLAFPQEFNEEARHDIGRGQTALNVVLDRPTRVGQDPADAPENDLGAGGVSLATLADVSTLFRGVDLDRVAVQCFAGVTALPLIATLAVALQDNERGINYLYRTQGCVGSDPLGVLAADGHLALSLGTAYDSMYQATAWSLKKAPKLQTIFVQGHPYHDAGASSTEEVAFALATAAEYLREMIGRGLAIDDVAPRIRFGFSLGSAFFMEIAKLRAARLLWAQIVSAFGGSPEARKMTIHGRSSAFNKTVFDPYVNMLRVTSEGFSGAVGGVDSMHLAPFDEPIRSPDRFSRRIARNVQIVLQEESRFTVPIDMGGGSYYIEKMTHEFGQAAWRLFQEIEKSGGMAAAIGAGTPQTMAAATAAKRAKAVETRSDVVLGTNMYANLSEKKLEAPIVDRAAMKKARVTEVARYRRAHQRYSLGFDLTAIEKGFAGAGGDALELAIDAVVGGATLGELFEVLARLDADRPAAPPLRIARLTESFERLRREVEKKFAEEGRRVRIFLANMGPIPQHKPRADFSRGFFEVAGFDVLGNEGFPTVEAAAEAVSASGAPVVVICSTDATYPDYVPELTRRVKAARPEVTVIVAGKQSPEATEAFNAAGVDDYIHVRANCYEINRKLHEKYMG